MNETTATLAAALVPVEVGSPSIPLEVGDAVAFPGDVAHQGANSSAQPAGFSLAVFEPGTGPGRSEVTGA